MNNFDIFMHGGGWVAFTFVAVIFSAALYLINQYMKQPGLDLVFWSRVITVLALTPFALHIVMPQSPSFYVAVVASAFFSSFGDIRTYDVAARYGGGVVSRTQPLIIFLTFFVWFAFEPSLFHQYVQHPVNTALVLLALGGCGYFSSRLKKCDISHRALLEMLPAILAYTGSTVLNKYAMTHGPLVGAVYGYLYIQSIAVSIIAGGTLLLRNRKNKKLAIASPDKTQTRKMTQAALLAAFFWICCMVFKNSAMAFVPNPAYLSALLYTAPVLIALFYKITGHKEEADVMSGMGVVACAALLALVTV